MKQENRAKKKLQTGTVISNKMEKTVVVRVERKMRHKRYGKVVVLGKRYYADAGQKTYQVGDTVTIQESRPLSKLKRWRVIEQESQV